MVGLALSISDIVRFVNAIGRKGGHASPRSKWLKLEDGLSAVLLWYCESCYMYVEND